MDPDPEPPADPGEWRRRGFFGPWLMAETRKTALVGDPRIGAMLPPAGEPPIVVDPGTGTTGMFAIWDRATDPLPVPVGLVEAAPDLVGRLVGG